MDSPKRIPRIGWVIAFIAATALLGMVWVNLKGTRPSDKQALPVLATVPEFSFTSQTGKTVTREDLLGKIWVANFIFTRCPGPCPMMTSRMAELQAAVEKAGGNVHLVSVSVDPEHDTPEVLTKYGERFGANPQWWTFLTGPRAQIDEFVTKGMLLPLARDGEGVPTHSQKFLVIDEEGRIRSFHELDDGELIPKVLMDIGALIREASKKKTTTGS